MTTSDRLDLPAMLEEALRKGEASIYRNAFLLCSYYSTLSDQRYCAYRPVYRKMLEGRKYKLEVLNDQIAILFLDKKYNPQTFKNEDVV